MALTRKGTLAFYTVTGYFESHNSGVRLEELGQLMVDDHARDAFCLDGGHSSMMVVKGDPVSRAPGNRVPERKVANCLAIFQEGTDRFPCHIEGHVDRSELPADGKSTATIELKVTDFQGRPVPDGTPVRFFTTLGSIPWYGATRGGTARGTVTSAPFPGKAAVSAECGFTRTDVAVIHFKAGEPFSLKALVAPLFLPLPEHGRDEKGRLLQVLVRDGCGNPLASVSLQAEVFHGSSRLSVLSGVSNSRGVAEFRLPESVKGERLKVSCGKLSLLVTGKGSSAKQPVIDGVPDTKKGR